MLYFLLQGSSPLEARQNPLYLQVFFGILLLLVPIILVAKLINYQSEKREKKRRKNPHAFAPSFKAVKKAAQEYGLNRQQTAFFDQICKKYRIQNPEFLLKNEIAADRLFKTIFHSLDISGNSENAENAKLLIFSIRQQIETHRRLSRVVGSTKNIARNQKLTISSKRLDSSASVVLDNAQDGLVISIPRDEYNNEVRLPLLSRIHVYFQLNTGLSYMFNAFLLRYINKEKMSAMVLSHNKKLMPMHNRSFKRIELDKNCLFSFVRVSKKGRGANVQTIYSPLSDRYRGVLIDISGGGCCMKSNHPVNQGSIISIELQLEKNMDPVIARVVRISRVPEGKGYILNIQFMRMKKYVRNLIYSYIYDYA